MNANTHLGRAPAASAPPDLMTTEEAAELLRTSPKTLANQRVRGDGPPYLRLSRGAIRYSRSALAAWLREREVTPDGSSRRTALA